LSRSGASESPMVRRGNQRSHRWRCEGGVKESKRERRGDLGVPEGSRQGCWWAPISTGYQQGLPARAQTGAVGGEKKAAQEKKTRLAMAAPGGRCCKGQTGPDHRRGHGRARSLSPENDPARHWVRRSIFSKKNQRGFWVGAKAVGKAHGSLRSFARFTSGLRAPREK
jgi:hypothetical protein